MHIICTLTKPYSRTEHKPLYIRGNRSYTNHMTLFDICYSLYMFFEFLYYAFIMFPLFLFVLTYCYIPHQYNHIFYFNRLSVLYEQSCCRMDTLLARMLVSIVLYTYHHG